VERIAFTIGSMGSPTHASLSATPDERLFIGATYVDLPAADADFEALRQLSTDVGASGAFDAVTIGRKSSGEVRFHRERDGFPSLAAGLATALFPSVAADIPVGRQVEREILGTVAGVVAIGLGRSGLREVGTVLDSSAAGLIVVATAEQQDGVMAVLAHAQRTIARSAIVDVEKVERMADQLDRAASRRRRPTS